MEISKIVAEIKRLRPKAQERFAENLIMLISQIERSVILRGPYRLVVDSNILMRLESYRTGNITEGLLSILLAFALIKRLPFHIDVVIRPVVFYEFLRLKNVTSTREHWEKFKDLKSIIEDELEIILFFDGIETYAGAEYYGKLIESDANKIANTLRSYQERDWRFDFIRKAGGFDGAWLGNGLIEVAPLFAAHGLYAEIGLEYFNEKRASIFFIEHIEKHITECPRNNKEIIKKYAKKNYLLTKILKLSPKGILVGLADIDILTLCNIQSQFNDQALGRYVPASIGMSIDENLSKALHFFSTIHLSSSQMMGGEKNISDNFAKMDAFIHEQNRIKEGEKREQIARHLTESFIDEIHSHGIFESPM